MGFIWNVMLLFSYDELWEDGEDEPRETCEPLERINAWIIAGELVSLVGPTYEDQAGYGMDPNLYGGGFKHFDIDAFIEVVESQDWKNREKVQLWTKGCEEGTDNDLFTPVNLRRRKAVRPNTDAPPPKAKRRSRTHT